MKSFLALFKSLFSNEIFPVSQIGVAGNHGYSYFDGEKKNSSKLPIRIGAGVQLNVCRIGQQSTLLRPNDDMGRVMTCGD